MRIICFSDIIVHFDPGCKSFFVLPVTGDTKNDEKPESCSEQARYDGRKGENNAFSEGKSDTDLWRFYRNRRVRAGGPDFRLFPRPFRGRIRTGEDEDESYPCTGYITMDGFGTWLEKETKASRYNIRQFENELKQQFSVPYLTLVNSGSSANMVAALVLAEKVKKAGKPLTAAVSAFTFPTTISALSLAGFDLAIVDTEENGFNISLSELKKLDPVPSVFVVTHVRDRSEICYEKTGIKE